MMRYPRMAAAAVLLLATAPAGAAGISELGWLAGAWVTEGSGEAADWTEERWAPPRGGMMLGTGLSGRGGKATSYEYMRIAADGQGIISFWGSPRGATPVPFRLVSVSDNEAVFENPAHDFPTRIVYRRTADALVATVSGPKGANAQSWRYRKAAR